MSLYQKKNSPMVCSAASKAKAVKSSISKVSKSKPSKSKPSKSKGKPQPAVHSGLKPVKPASTKLSVKAKTETAPLVKGPRKWVIVQLSPNGEREKNIPSIIRSARHLLQDKTIEVCVPAVSQKVREDSHTMFYWDGYIFIEYIEGRPYLKLNETAYFQNVLCRPGLNSNRQRVFSFLSDRDLEPMKRGLENMKLGEFEENDDVKIIKGQFKNLLGKVSFVHEGSENVQVFVGLRSKQILMDFPASYLVKVHS